MAQEPPQGSAFALLSEKLNRRSAVDKLTHEFLESFELVGRPWLWFAVAMTWSIGHRSNRWLGLILVWVVVLGCSTVAITGRKQLILISQEQEMQLGLTAFQQIRAEVPISQNASATAMLEQVGQRIAAVAELPNAQWEFVLFEDPQANAFCLPGGKVGIYTGILPITKNEEGLATVIGHEVAHAVARHGGERISVGMLQQAGAQLAAAAGSYFELDPNTQVAVGLAYGFGSQVGAVLPHSRLQESEADHLGLIYMAQAGYPPEEAIGFWQRFSDFNQQAGGSTPEIFRTHPVDAKRIAQLREWMPEAQAYYRRATNQ